VQWSSVVWWDFRALISGWFHTEHISGDHSPVFFSEPSPPSRLCTRDSRYSLRLLRKLEMYSFIAVTNRLTSR
jgi:hypothetical protein